MFNYPYQPYLIWLHRTILPFQPNHCLRYPWNILFTFYSLWPSPHTVKSNEVSPVLQQKKKKKECLWYTHTYTHMHWNIIQPREKKEVMSLAITRMDFDVIMLNVLEKHKYCIVSLTCGICKANLIETQ